MYKFARMRPWRLRGLTWSERRLAHDVFGDGLDGERVRLLAQTVWPRAFVAGPGLMVWPARAALRDFAAPGVPLSLAAVFVHELTHVWQAQRGVNLLFAKFRAGDGPRAYDYGMLGERGFEELNIEQQAMVVQHAFMAERGAAAPYPAELYLAAAASWRGSPGTSRPDRSPGPRTA